MLGYGCMRFTQKAGRPDVDKTEREIMTAFEAGVNYYDTAYVYPGSEAALGEITQRNGIRDRINITTKLPHYLLKKEGDADRYFQEELKRLRTDHVDYYLMHMLTDVRTWERLCGLGVDRWLRERQAAGQIGQIGFSYHGNSDMFCQILDAWDWDLCQIQYNYPDENSQAGRTGLAHAASKGLPVIIMEPLRGGRLVNRLPERARALFAGSGRGWTPAEWSFNWLWDQPEVTCVLSGMNSVEMVEENVRSAAAAEAGALTAEDRALLAQVVAAINEKMKVGCTGCRYCMPCPQKVDIPGTFAAYNRRYTDGRIRALTEYVMCTALRKDATGASNCIQCGRCEQHCPQHIAIREELKNARKVLETPVYKAVKKFAPLFVKY